ncbi:RRP15-like protein [Babylonia areolata]|uniref:RRP15-like protein n=1 Tax=Babylonia areolata TaxID=304850 RepID=UPI003FCF129E
MASTRVSVDVDISSDDEIHDDFLDDAGSEDNTEVTEMETSQEKNSGCGITDVMAKILDNPVPKQKGAILARGQTDHEIKRKKKMKEKDSEDAEKPVKKRKTKSKDGGDSSSDWTDDSEEDSRRSHLQMKKKKEWDHMGRVKPSVLTKDKERMLQRIATRGVVQLFNAARQQQRMVKEKMEEAGSSVRRRDKVMGSISKKQFLDLLDNSQANTDSSKATKKQGDLPSEEAGGKWSILRDDYMMKARMKDWDRDSGHEDDDDDDGR